MTRMIGNLFERLTQLRARFARSIARKCQAFRPALEALEARDLPSSAPLLQVSSNGRYLVAAGTNQPFYLVGDSPWEMSTNITETEASQYFQQRASQGFNTVIIQAVNQVYTGSSEAHPPADTSGDLPFAKLADGNFDLSKPNAPYWQHIDNLVNLASQNGIEVILFPAFYGTKIFSNDYDWGTHFNDPANTANNNANIKAWGQFLGQRYVNDNNIIWAVGGDYNSLENSASDGQLASLLQGIQQFDTRHLTTMEGWDGFNSSAPRTAFTNTNLRPYMTLDGVYVSHTRPFSSLFQQEYSSGNSPNFLIESTYEDNGTNTGGTSLSDVRHEAYVDFLSGTTGYMFGNDLIWEFGTGWQQQMTSPGAQDMTYFGGLVNSLPWSNLVPDWSGAVFQGVSTSTDYVGEYAADGSLALAYKPSTGTGSQSFTVNMAKFSGPVTAQWFDPTNGTYITIGTGLANSGTQTFTSPSTNSAGQNDFVLILKASPATVPAAPANLTATAGNAQVTLTWTASSGATSYNIYRSTTSGGEGTTPIATGISSSSYTNTGLTNGTTYFYKVAAVNSAGTSPLSSEASATPQVAAPAAPTNLAATAGNAQVSLTWTASSGAASYNIYRSTTSGGEGSTPIATGVGTTSYTDTGLTNGTTYFYQVAAVNTGGTSAKSAETSATPSTQVFIGEQTILSSVDSNNGNWLIAQLATLSQAATIQSLSLYASTAAGKVRLGVYDATGPGGGPGKLLAAANEITPVTGWNTASVVTPVTLAAGSYWLAFLPSDNNLAMPIASTGSAAWYQFTYGALPATFSTTPTDATAHWSVYATLALNTVSVPAAPTNLAATAGNAQVSLTWTAPSGASSYNVYRSTSTGTETLLASGVGSTSYTDTGLTNGTTYFYKVAAVNGAGTGPLSGEASATPQVAAPAAPTNLAATAGNAQVSLTWTASSGATSYNIYRSTSSGGEGSTPIATGITVTSFTDMGLTNGTTYFYKVAAVNAGGTSPPSAEASATPQVPAPAAPTNLAATAGNAQVSLTWTASSGATSYNIYRSTSSGGEGSTPIAAGITVTSFTDTGLTNGTTYFYRVAAVNAGGTSPQSGEASATPQGTGSTVTLIPTANAYVRDGSYAAMNFGGATQLQSKLGDTPGNTGWNRNIFLQFNISTLTSVSSATLMLYGNLTGTTPTNMVETVYGVADNTWTESGITWNNQPAIGTTALASNTVIDSTPRWYSFDITSYIQAAKASGASLVSIALQMTTFDSSAYVAFNSREATSNTPQLVVSSAAAPPTISSQPASATVTAGQPASFSVVASGTAPLTYQWQKQLSGTWTNISGASAASFSISAAAATDAGSYRVIVTNSAGSATSNTATLTVNPAVPPAPTNLGGTAGNAQVTLTWTAASGATSYNIYRGTSSGGESSSPIATGVTGTTLTDTGLSNGTTYFYKVAAINSSGTSPLSSEASATPRATGTLVTAISAGGPASGTFVADTNFSGGNVSGGTAATIDTSHVTNPAPMSVYQHGRYGNMTYTIPNLTPGATYTVRLDFVEYYWSGPGQRVFNVAINGTQVLSNFDIFATAGGKNIAIAETFTATASSSGMISIAFTSVADNAMINGIEIYTA
jgi:fibronectin type 3 domain-containing protein